LDRNFANKTAKVWIIHSVTNRRFLISQTVRELGFEVTEAFQDLSAFHEILGDVVPDWIICDLQDDRDFNALKLLTEICASSTYRHARVTLSLSDAEMIHLPLAFEMGLFSYFSASSVQDVINKELNATIGSFEKYDWDATLLSASYLSRYLKQNRHFKHLLGFQLDLVQQYPGNSRVLLALAEAQAMTGNLELAMTALDQVALLDKDLLSDVEHIRKLYCSEETLLLATEPKSRSKNAKSLSILGIRDCVIIDPDTSMQYVLKELLKQFGVTEIQCFSDGNEAWDWLKLHPEPSLILQEWRLPSLSGPLFIQRLRSHPYVQVPILVLSSLIKPSEYPLVLEMGVAAVLEKPFEQDQLVQAIVTALQQTRRPTEQHSLERRIRQLLEAKKMEEASRLLGIFMSEARISVAAKKTIEAEYRFHEGSFKVARNLASEAFKLDGGKSLLLINLLGKCLLKTGQFDLALKCFKKAQEISPLNIERLCKIAEIHQDLGSNEERDKALKAASDLDADSQHVSETRTCLALVNGDLATAQSNLDKLDGMNSLLGMMNNRAVALIKAGSFTDGIELYKRTLAVLPESQVVYQAAVRYNLALGHARYGEFDKGLETLASIDAAATQIKRKSDALGHRLKRALVSGANFVVTPDVENAGKLVEAEETAQSDYNLLFEVQKCEICCYLLYRAMDLITVPTLKLLRVCVIR
jgi:CheY-like chemotaxis protein/Tfp pilus assembly protein PilF